MLLHPFRLGSFLKGDVSVVAKNLKRERNPLKDLTRKLLVSVDGFIFATLKEINTDVPFLKRFKKDLLR